MRRNEKEEKKKPNGENSQPLSLDLRRVSGNPREPPRATAAAMEPPGISRITSPDTPNTSSSDDLSRKARKPYTITKYRESWTEPEHDKFFEALQLFDRDWKKIEAYIGTKTAIQIRSHAQKYFLKAQKSGSNEHLPPPRPKRKAAHPYPQKAAKNGPPAMLKSPSSGGALSSWSVNSAQPLCMPHVTEGDMSSAGQMAANICSSSMESTPMAQTDNEPNEQMNHDPPLRVLPDFVQVYSFIGSVFDPDASDHLQRLKRMDPIDVETILLLMRNLSINLNSPDFEDHRQLLSSYEISSDNAYPGDAVVICDG